MKILFLDIDGVLNRGAFSTEAESTSLDPDLVRRLNALLAATNAKVVVSSSWRYMVLTGAMTLSGFEYLLRTHGLRRGVVLDTTISDEAVPGRAAQIRAWLAEHPNVTAWAAVDDGDLAPEFGADAARFVRTDGAVGLSDADATGLRALLSPDRPAPG